MIRPLSGIPNGYDILLNIAVPEPFYQGDVKVHPSDFNVMLGLRPPDPSFAFSVTRDDKAAAPTWMPVCSDTSSRVCEIQYKGNVYLGHIVGGGTVYIFMPNYNCPRSIDRNICSYRPLPRGVSYTIAGA